MPSVRRSYSHGPSHTGLGNKTLLRTQRFMQAKTCIFSFLWSSGRRMIPQRIVPARYGDTRGWFTESYNKRVLTALGIGCDFVQDNHSFSAARGTLRGIHFQSPPHAQAKLVRCLAGARSEEHTSELQSLMRISYAVFC